jgi:hypothetical protein
MVILFISALGLIAALAWDEAFKELFKRIFVDLTIMQEKFLYAILITVIAVLASVILGKLVLKK